MSRLRSSKIFWLVLLIVALCAAGIGLALFSGQLAPLGLVSAYSWQVLSSEASTMNECAECHEAVDFHTCEACHDEHGAIELAGIPFFAYVELSGDVPEPGFVMIDEILPHHQANTHIALLDFLASRGITDFETITLAAGDGGFVTLERQALTNRALLLPYEDGIRFACEDLHVSTWMKGIRRMIVVGAEKPLTIAGQATSFGRLLLGPTRAVTVEQTPVMLASPLDGQVRKAFTASRLEGVALADLLAGASYKQVRAIDLEGRPHTLSQAEAQSAVLVSIQGQLTLVLPERGRAQWIEGLSAIEIED